MPWSLFSECWVLSQLFHSPLSLSCIGEGNGSPLQCSCLENPRDGGAWWAVVYGVAQSRTWLKRLSSSSGHPYGRKRRRTKEPLGEIERGEWKSWLKIQHSKNKDHGIWSHCFMADRWGNSGNSDRLFSWAPKSLQIVTATMQLKDACSLEEKLWDQPRQHIKKQRHYFANRGPSSQGFGFSSNVWMWELDYKKAEHWRIDAFELWCWRRLLRESLGLQGDPTSPS